LRGAWGHLSHRNRDWAVNILIGVAIEIGLQLALDAPIVVAARNWALDTAMIDDAAVRTLRRGHIAPQDLAFIDVDEETWRDPLWGNSEPYRAPRDGLLTLIDYAIEREARYIVLDVIIEGSNDPDDARFAEQIEQRATRLKPSQHILFVRTLREPLPGMQDRLAPELRPSALDDVIKCHPEQLHAVAPYFRVSRDGVLRDWQMWRTGCRRSTVGEIAAGNAERGKGHWEILPSVQLAIAALMLSDRAKFPWNKPAEEGSCIIDLAAYKSSGIPVSTFRSDDDAMWKWLPKSGLPHASEVEKPSDATIPLTNRIFFKFRYRQEPSVLLIPALAILKQTPHSDVAKDGVVVIGQSFEAAHDLHATPIGVMPGPMVLINSLESMWKPGFLQEPGCASRLAILGTSIVVVGFIFAYRDYVIASLVILTLFVPLLIILNFVLLQHGIWMDFAIPLLGMYLHKLIEELKAYRDRAQHAGPHRKGGD